MRKIKLPSFLQPYLASYDLKKIDTSDENVRHEIISQILNEGSLKAIIWLFKHFRLEEIRKVIVYPSRGIWFNESLLYWSKILNIFPKEREIKQAILDINPKF